MVLGWEDRHSGSCNIFLSVPNAWWKSWIVKYQKRRCSQVCSYNECVLIFEQSLAKLGRRRTSSSSTTISPGIETDDLTGDWNSWLKLMVSIWKWNTERGWSRNVGFVGKVWNRLLNMLQLIHYFSTDSTEMNVDLHVKRFQEIKGLHE